MLHLYHLLYDWTVYFVLSFQLPCSFWICVNNSLVGHILQAPPHTLGKHSSSMWCSQTSWLWLSFFISHYFNCCIWIPNKKPRDSVTMGSFQRFKALQHYILFFFFFKLAYSWSASLLWLGNTRTLPGVQGSSVSNTMLLHAVGASSPSKHTTSPGSNLPLHK